ncbi:hypothetical protein C8R43DRAFT_883257 [Mycena crocata]|nr:hypothetical protein C8R43DRAFT_883257 [Mycena crocata]
MGSDYCSAPGTCVSVDAKHTFSEGRCEVTFLQHNMGSQTFCAEMVLGSWDGQPFFPTSLNSQKSSNKGCGGEGKIDL